MATSDPTPAQQPDGGAEEWTLVSIPMVGNGRCQLCPRRAGNLFRVPTGILLCGDCRTAWREGYRAHAGASIPPASPREAVYRAVDAFLNFLDRAARRDKKRAWTVTSVANEIAADGGMRFAFQSYFFHVREAAIAARKESADAR